MDSKPELDEDGNRIIVRQRDVEGPSRVLRRFLDGYPLSALPENGEEMVRGEFQRLRKAFDRFEWGCKALMEIAQHDMLDDSERLEQSDWVRWFSSGEAHGKMLVVQGISIIYNDVIRLALEP